jgi:hypothetical protein
MYVREIYFRTPYAHFITLMASALTGMWKESIVTASNVSLQPVVIMFPEYQWEEPLPFPMAANFKFQPITSHARIRLKMSE